MSLSSDEINLLIQHYLQEFGYDHSAFAFGAESKIPLNTKIANRYVPPGSLVYLIQKGMMLSQIEKHAEDSVSSPSQSINNEINLIKLSLHQSSEANQDMLKATKLLQLFPKMGSDKNDSNNHDNENLMFHLDTECSLFLEGHTKPVIFAAWTKESDLLATASADGNAIVWKFDNENSFIFDDPIVLSPCCSSPQPDITSIAWCDIDNILAVGTFSGLIVLYQKENIIFRLSELHKAPIVSLHFARKSSLLASASTDGQIIVSKNGVVKGKWNVEPPISDVKFFTNNSLYFSSNKTVYALTLFFDDDDTEKIQNDQLPVPEKVVEMKGEIIQITLSHSFNFMAIGDDQGNFTIIDKHRKIVCSQNKLHDSSICSISAAVNTDSFTTGGCDGFVKLIDVKQPEPIVFDGHARASYLVAYDPLDRFIASTGYDRILNIWNISTNRIMYRFLVDVLIDFLVWSPNGKFLAICLHSGQVSLIDFENIDM